MDKQKLITKLRKIRDIPENSKKSCHEDHLEMSDKLNKVIGELIKN